VKKESYEKIELFLAHVNKVTCPHRHGQKISKRDLDALSNDQIVMEAWLAENKPEEEIHCDYQGGCGSRMNERYERMDPCELYIKSDTNKIYG
jgi:hypothetical protein